jgi:pyruvate dehydrogenase E2 component (dihydrolipoamide acetyltransferase)
MAEFRMPSLGPDMTSGTLVEWLIKAGDHVKRGDVVAVVETDKGTIDVEIFDSGLISQLVVPSGTTVPVGAVLALLDGEKAPEVVRAPEVAAPEVAAPTEVVAPPVGTTPLEPKARLHASPLARRRAAELGVELSQVRGSRPGGAITVADVEKAAALAKAPAPAAPAPPAPAKRSPEEQQAAMRAAIAAAMSRANREIPHYYLGTEIDMKRSLDWLMATNLKRPVSDRLLATVLLLKAVALAVHDVPEMNGFYTDAGFQPSDAVHVGVAIFLRGGGLVAPAIHNADQLNLDALMAKLRDLISRARGGKLRSSEIADPTITITNLGEQGVPQVYGLIYPPQVALVGFGTIVERPWAVAGLLGVRPILTATLSADHRVSDGHRGARFLAAIDKRLQAPETL